MTEQEVLERVGERQGRYINHVAKSCRQHEIDLEFKSQGGMAFHGSLHIQIGAVRGDVTYTVALHELGHIVGPKQKRAPPGAGGRRVDLGTRQRLRVDCKDGCQNAEVLAVVPELGAAR